VKIEDHIKSIKMTHSFVEALLLSLGLLNPIPLQQLFEAFLYQIRWTLWHSSNRGCRIVYGGLRLIFATDLGDPEGPVALPDGTWLVVEGTAARGCVTQISSDGKKKRIIQKTGLPNGLAVDRHGVIWVAESEVPSLIRLTMEGKAEVVATNCDGEPFLFPNDLCFGPDGTLYLTDSGILVPNFCPGNKIRPDYMSLKYDGRVYRVDVGSGKVTMLDNGIQFTNGIAFGPDGLLYVNETITGNIYSYGIENGSVAGRRTPFGNVIHPDAPPGFKGPDGMAFSTDGRLYVAVFGQHDIIVLGRTEKSSRELKLPETYLLTWHSLSPATNG